MAASFGIDEMNDDCERNYKKGKLLGRGEQGSAYEVNYNKMSDASKPMVLKISNLDNKEKIEAWKKEAHIAYTLGESDIGPKIYKVWICNKDGVKGYIIMDRMISDLRSINKYADKIKYLNNGEEYIEYVDHINNVSEIIQRDFLHGLERMIDIGYIHMDNHPGNLGIIISDDREKGILFDFGFTQKRDDLLSPDAKRMALGFSIAQIIEQMPLEERKDNFIYKIFVAIEQNKYKWGSGVVPDDVNLAEFAKKYYSTSEKYRSLSLKSKPIDIPKDIYIGFHLYCYIMMLDRETMVNRKNYEKIYKIRQGMLGGKRRTRHRRRLHSKKHKQSRKHKTLYSRFRNL